MTEGVSRLNEVRGEVGVESVLSFRSIQPCTALSSAVIAVERTRIPSMRLAKVV